MNVWAYIISYNRLSCLKKTLDGLKHMIEHDAFYIFDMGSDYKPLLDYYRILADEWIEIIRFPKINTPSDLNIIASEIQRINKVSWFDFYIVTDPDIVLVNPKKEFVETAVKILNYLPNCEVVWPMLKIDDIPQTYWLRDNVLFSHIIQFWGKRPNSMTIGTDSKPVFYQEATIDTTLWIYRSWTWFRRLKRGVRLYSPYDAYHLDWYFDSNNLPKDQTQYLTSSSKGISHRTKKIPNIQKSLPYFLRKIYQVKDGKILPMYLKRSKKRNIISQSASLILGILHYTKEKVRNGIDTLSWPLYGHILLWYKILKREPIYQREFLLFPSKKLVYLVISKVANSSIRKSLLKAMEYSPHTIKDNYSVHYAINWNKVSNLKQVDSEYFSFTFVRNPFTRIVSAYKSKFLKDVKIWIWFSLWNYLHWYFRQDDSFGEVVAKVCKMPDFFSDSHFKSQYSQIYSNKKRVVNYVWKMETIAQDFEPIRLKFDLDPLPHFNKTDMQQDSYMDRYTPELVEKVYKRYKKDVHEFWYYDDYLALKEYVSNGKNE